MTAERDLKDAMKTSDLIEELNPRLPHKKGSSHMSPPKFEDRDALRVPGVTIDFRVPLWQIVGAGGVFVVGLIGMYYQLAELTRNVVELQATVKTMNALTVQYTYEQGYIKHRLDKLEREVEARKESQRSAK